jgi:hypothetical protein
VPAAAVVDAAEGAVVVADVPVVAADVVSSSSPHDTSSRPVTVKATAHRTARDEVQLRTMNYLHVCLWLLSSRRSRC